LNIYILDTFAFLFKSYYALPPLENRDGFPTGLLTGFIKTLLSFEKKFELSNLIFALEGDRNFRKEISEEYKSNRGEAPDDFKLQTALILDWISKMGFTTFQHPEYEADDIIASLSRRFEKEGNRVYILSYDKDFNQLISENISILHPEKMKVLTAEDVQKKFGVLPEKFIDFQALVGDTIDNVSGVKGIGKVTASKLLNEFQNLEEIYENLEKISNSIRKKLEIGKEDAFKSREMVTLHTGIQVGVSDFQNRKSSPFLEVVDDFVKYEISAPIQKLLKNGEISKEYLDKKENQNFEFEVKTILDFEELSEILSKIPDDTVVAFDTETTGVDPFRDDLIGFSFSFEENNGFYVPLKHNYLGVPVQMRLEEVPISEFLRFNLVGHNFKFDSHIIFGAFGVELFPISDTMVLAWLEDSREKLSLDNLAYKKLKHKMVKFKDVVPKGGSFGDVELESASFYAVEDAVATLRLWKLFSKSDRREFEEEFLKVLISMEREGIAVDLEYLKSYEEKLEKKIEKVLENDKFQNVNLNSPKQVATLLYDTLGIPEVNGRKTDEGTLREIKHEIVSEILKYRELSKLKSTYILPLQKHGEVGRIHTTFSQTGTATGRLSSREPNLQNIPVSSGVRESFVAKEGYSLLSLDYSQIELRFLAHYSEDKTLIESFQNSEDIHTTVAEKLGVSRREAKSVNFGLLYGMGYKKLAKTLQIEDSVAKEILKNYFDTFPTIRDFIKREHQKVFEIGFVETFLGFRRYFSAPKSQREIAEIEREALNTLFQGSSADLIKLAMVEIYKKELSAKLLLQIHDELIFEVKDENLEVVAKECKEIMENSISLKVPLVVNWKSSKKWESI
jgi:DNA polymerase-1